MNKVVAEVTAWSLQHAAAGKAPESGFYGEPFGSKSYRFEMRGKQLAGGYRKLVCVRHLMFFLWPVYEFLTLPTDVVLSCEASICCLQGRPESPHAVQQVSEAVLRLQAVL